MNPVEYTGRHLDFVEAYTNKPRAEKSGNFWADESVSATKAVIKTHYIQSQNYQCCYCQQQVLQQNHDVWDVEHIIPKSTHPQFMFQPLNLAVSCGPCNEAKGEQNVLKNPKRKTFPSQSSDYLIVHPHFDVYDDHILWFGPVVASNGSNKGEKTITLCKLDRIAAQQGGFNSDLLGSAFRSLVGNLMTTRRRVDGEAIYAALGVYISRLPD